MLRRALYLVCLAAPCQAATLSLTNDGLVIDAGTMGRFTLSYPSLSLAQGEPLKPVQRNIAGRQATVAYAGGGQISLSLADDGTVSLAFGNLPAGLKSWRMEMLIDFGYSDGGTWRIGGGAATPFPAAKPDKPFLFQGNETSFQLTDNLGQTLSFALPQYSYQQLQDNREWNWKIFGWFFQAPYDANNPRATFTIAQSAAGEGPAGPLVDRWGQDARLGFPGKVTSDDDLKGDIARDEAYYASLRPPETDPYGGLPGSGAKLGLRPTGYFHVQQVDGRWLLVDPDGNATFHLGICGFGPSDDYTYIKGREAIYAWLPGYDGEFHTAFHPDAYWSRDALSFYLCNVIRKYGRPFDRETWTARMIQRVRQLGFNSTGAFSGSTKAHHELRFPWVSSLPLSEWQLGRQVPGLRGLFDPFDPQTAAKMDSLFAEHIAPSAHEPLLIGYFLANEQAFEDIPRAIPALPAGAPAKQRLVALLEERYPSIAAFNTAWGTKAADFDAVAAMGLPVTTQAAADDIQAYTALFIDAYFKLIADTYHKYDTHHLLLGNRWMPSTANNETLCRIAGKYLDVISVNYYTYALDTGYLKRIDDWCGGRPMILSEFYWSSPSDTGLPGGSEVANQHDRGLAYRNYVEGAAASGFVVGVEWFTLIDQARSGRWFERYTGEKANTGLFNVADRPYRQFLAEATRTNYGIYQVELGEQPPFVFDHPRFKVSGPGGKVVKVPRAPGAMVLDGKRDDWPGVPAELIPGARIVQGSDATGFEAAFWACWDDARLYLMVQVTDPTPMKNEQEGASLWNADAVELFVGPDQPDKDGPLLFSDRQVLLGAGRTGAEARWFYAHSPQQGPCELVVVPSVDGKGYVLEAALPFAALGFTPQADQAIRFDLGVDDSTTGTGRQRQLMWNGGARNSSDRTGWGRAVFLR